MARSIPADRFRRLVDVATRTFITNGYRLTQMADVADALGVAKGTLYGYVESKDALFDAVVRHADGHVTLPRVDELPLRTPAPGATVAFVQERLAGETADLVLLRVASGDLVIDDPRDELAAVLSDLYRRLARNRLVLKLVDRCAAEYPELGGVWFAEGRWAQHQLLVHVIARGIASDRYRPMASPEVVARTVLETVAFWAMHRHFDPSPQQVTDDEAEQAVVDFVSHALLLITPRRPR
ncbi:MAG: helix-turn-helix domain-containing protein [Myxococcota bacterium]